MFADVTYAATPKLDLTVGARYYELRSSLENVQTGVLAAPNQPLIRADASGTSPRAVIAYRATDDLMFYATAARGYRPGGPNVGLPDGIGCELVDAYQPLYDPDSVWNYELGAKSEFMQRRLSINVALYHIDWKDVQQAVADPGCGYLIVANVGEARSRGVEAEIMMRPIDNLTLSAAASYTDAEFTSIADAYQLASAATTGRSAARHSAQEVQRRRAVRPRAGRRSLLVRPRGLDLPELRAERVHDAESPAVLRHRSARAPPTASGDTRCHSTAAT